MSSSEDQNLIEVLPEEVLSEIFKWLDVESVKNASLVCQQWNRIIFSNQNIQRFCLVIDTGTLYSIIRGILSKNWDAYSKWSHRKRKQFRREIQHEEIQRIVQSQRCYRSLLWKQSREKEDIYLFKSLHPWKTEHLRTLKVHIYLDHYKNEMLKLLDSVIRRMPQLHSLELSAMDNYETEEKPWVELHSKTVKKLKLDDGGTIFPAVFDMPAVQTLTTRSRTIYQVAHNFPLEHLKDLTLDNLYDISDYQPNIDVHRRLTNLESLRCIHGIQEEEFLAICKHFRFLKELVIISRMPNPQATAFNQLAKLSNLGKLKLQDMNMAGTVTCDFVKLSNLRYLNLIEISEANSLVLRLPPSIITFKLTVTPQNEGSLMRVITSSLPNLKMLGIHLRRDDHRVVHAPIVTLRLLPLLTQLEVVKFSHGYFSKSCLLNMTAPMHQMRHLRLRNCMLQTENLKGLHDKFPKLKRLEFEHCDLRSGGFIKEKYLCF